MDCLLLASASDTVRPIATASALGSIGVALLGWCPKLFVDPW